MLTNDIKKGMRVQLKNGWFATMMDNKKGNIRFANVEGYFTEMGSIYAADIARVQVGDKWEKVETTAKQKEVASFMDLF